MAKTVTWKDIENRTCVLTINDGSSGTTALTPGEEPFVTSVDDGDDLFQPVRTSTGNIGIVIDSVDDVVSMIGRTPISTPVTLTVGGTTRWQGFLSCESFSQGWDKGPLDLALPVVSGLGVLGGVRYPYSGLSSLGYVSFAQFLVSMNAALDGIYSYFTFPNLSETETTLTYLFRMSNYATSDDKNTTYEMATYLDILTDICKLFGWQAVEYETNLVFLCADVKKVVSGNNMKRYTAAQMQSLANGTTVTPTGISFTAEVPTFFGVDHRRSFVAGKNKVDVVGQISEMPMAIWSMAVVEQCVYIGHEAYTPAMQSYEVKEYASYQASWAGSANGNILVRNSLTSMQVDTSHGYNVKFLNCRDNAGAYGGSVTYERFYKYNTYHERTAGDADFVFRMITRGNDNTLKEAVTIQTNFYYTPTQNSTDKFYIKGNVLFANAADDVFEKVTGTKYVRAVFKVGSYYYNGSTWSTTAVSMVMVVKDGEIKGYGHQTSGGFAWSSFIPAPSGVSGEVSMILVATLLDDANYGPGDEYVSYEDIEIQLKASTNRRTGVYIERKEIRTDVNENKVRMNNGFSEEWGQTCGLTLAREAVQDSNGVVLTSTRELPSSLYDSKYPEKALCDRVATYSAKARMVLYAVVNGHGGMLSPMKSYAMQSGGRPWICLCQTINWQNNEVVAGFFEPSYNS